MYALIFLPKRLVRDTTWTVNHGAPGWNRQTPQEVVDLLSQRLPEEGSGKFRCAWVNGSAEKGLAGCFDVLTAEIFWTSKQMHLEDENEALKEKFLKMMICNV